MTMSLTRIARPLRLACLLGGALLLGIGVRYLLAPEAATLTFGVGKRPQGYELYYITGLRNVWLGGLAIAFAALREWRALTLWFGMGAFVCFADATIAASSAGKWPHIAFHAGCGLACLLLAAGCWSLFQRSRHRNEG